MSTFRGDGSTLSDSPNGRGNLVIGYNEDGCGESNEQRVTQLNLGSKQMPTRWYCIHS
jgi:hypothetical protein